MSSAFLVSTPYQLLTALIMKLNMLPEEGVDLYVYDYFKNADKLVEKIERFKLFRIVSVCEVKGIYDKMNSNKLFRMKNYVFCRAFASKYFGRREKYENIYYSIPDRISIAAAKAFTDKEKGTHYFQIEDGFYNYYSPNLKKRNILEKICGCSKNLIERNVIYLYSPQLCIEKGITKEKIILPLNNKETISIINSVFGYESNEEIKRKILFFDTLGNGKITFSDKVQLRSINTIREVFGSEQYQLKVHPRRTGTVFQDCHIPIYSKQEIPFEIIALNEDLSDKILISFWSSAVFAPKIFSGKEPYIVLLYKLVNLPIEPDMLSFVDRLISNYSNSNKIIIPNTFDEFKECLEKLKTEVG